MNAKDLQMLADGLAPYLRNALVNRDVKIAGLEARITALEDRPVVRWKGVWHEQRLYMEASLVTRSGSLWIATEDTARQPGTPDSGWKLVVKSGHVPVDA